MIHDLSNMVLEIIVALLVLLCCGLWVRSCSVEKQLSEQIWALQCTPSYDLAPQDVPEYLLRQGISNWAWFRQTNKE